MSTKDDDKNPEIGDAVPTVHVVRTEGPLPPPDLENLVEQLPDAPEFRLDDYASAIVTLHDVKGFSFREVAEFLSRHGIDTNRTAVYRCYKDWHEAPPSAAEPLIDEDTGEVVEE